MADTAAFERFRDIPLMVEAILPGPTVTMADVLDLGVGSVLATSRALGETVDVVVGDAYLGTGELGEAAGRPTIRMVRFSGKQ